MNIQELAKLFNEYQEHSPTSDEAKQIKTQLILFLSSCYWWNSKYMLNLFPENIQQIQGKLQQEIADNFKICINKTSNSQELAELLLTEALILHKKYQKELITDKFINILAIQVKTTHPNSFQRKQAVQWLIKAIDTKNTYKKQGLGGNLQLSPQDYQDAFNEAKGESIRYALDNIDKYDDTKGDFMALINYWIPRKFIDAGVRILGIKKNQTHLKAESKISISTEDPNFMREYLYDNIEQKFGCSQKSQEIKTLIAEDPNNKLGKPIRKDKTHITFKDVLIAINWEGETFKNLSRKWEIPYTTIKSFYEREFQQVKADLADYLQ
ncbi:hypothetical protein [Anabaena sp. CCY 0017]|uniref:hypothetical protein n=1 Tax=Anabaena sp. CCY 0017 TaxID=3103866 RepID=UPI0039C6A404